MVVQSPWPAPEIPDTDVTVVRPPPRRAAGRHARADRRRRAAARSPTARSPPGWSASPPASPRRGFGARRRARAPPPEPPRVPARAARRAARRRRRHLRQPALHGAASSPTSCAARSARFVVTVGPLAETAARGGRRRRGARARRAAGRRPGRAARGAPRPRTTSRCCCPPAARPACPSSSSSRTARWWRTSCRCGIPFPAPEGGRQLGLAPFFHSMGLQCVLHRGLDAGGAIVTLMRFDLEQTLQAMQEHRVDQALVAPPLVAAFARHPVVDAVRPLRPAAARQRRRAARPRARACRRRAARLHRRPPGSASPRPARSCPCPDFPDPSRAPRRHLRPADPRQSRRRSSTASCGSAAAAFSTATSTTPPPPRRPSTPTAGSTPATSAEVDADGYVTLTGRLKELIKVSGFQVAPAELEAVLHRATRRSPTPAWPACPTSAAASARRHGSWSAGRSTRASSTTYVEERVAPYKKLVAIEPIDELPRTMTGKLLRRVLLERERTEVAVSP